jgi:hypothetical protein
MEGTPMKPARAVAFFGLIGSMVSAFACGGEVSLGSLRDSTAGSGSGGAADGGTFGNGGTKSTGGAGGDGETTTGTDGAEAGGFLVVTCDEDAGKLCPGMGTCIPDEKGVCDAKGCTICECKGGNCASGKTHFDASPAVCACVSN